MNDELVSRLKKAYPTGLVDELDETVLVSEQRDNRIKKVIQTVSRPSKNGPFGLNLAPEKWPPPNPRCAGTRG